MVVRRNEMKLAAEGNAHVYKSHFERKFEGFLVIKEQNCTLGSRGAGFSPEDYFDLGQQ